CSLYAGSNVLF
nr:immunoglobulin light chain junction region [Macaca mulatta]